MKLPKVAVLGLGAMGHAFAANLIKKDFTVFGWNRTRHRGEDLISLGLNLCGTPEDAARNAEVVILMLSDAEITHQIAEQIFTVLNESSCVIQMATIGVESTQRIKTLFNQRKDIYFFDAPVSGTKTPAQNGQIIVFASGDQEQYSRIEPVFNAISKAVKWQGEAGAGTRIKLVVNAWLISLMQGVAESMQLAQELGISTDDFLGCSRRRATSCPLY